MKLIISMAWSLATVAVAVVGLQGVPSSTVASTVESDIVPLPPTRVLDTRSGLGVAAPGPVVAASPIDVALAGIGPIPAAGVDAAVLNLTATGATAGTFVSVWPSGDTQPNASVLNVVPNQAFANLVVAKLGTDGQVSIANGLGSVHVIGDVVGWVPTGSAMVSVTPNRLLDTRVGTGVAVAGQVGPGQTVDLDVLGRAGVPTSGVDAVWLNVTATAATASSFVTVWPAGSQRPTASALNVSSPRPVPNLVLARVGSNGRVSMYNDTGSVHLIADIVAYVGAASSVVSLTPGRIVDSRQGVGVRPGRIGPGESVTFDAIGVGGVPSAGVDAVIINIAAVAPSGRSFVTAWPGGQPRPTASVLNTAAAVTVANLAIVPVGTDGTVSLYNDVGDLHLLADVVGYVAGPDVVTDPPARVERYRAGASIYAGAYRITYDMSGQETSRIETSHDELVNVIGVHASNTTTESGFLVMDRNVEPEDHIEATGPYVDPVSINRSMTASVLAGGVLAAARATIGLDVDVTDESMVITGHTRAGADLDGVEDRTPTLNTGGLVGFSANGSVEVSIDEPMMLTVSPSCPTIGAPFSVRGPDGLFLGDAAGCIDPMLLEPGHHVVQYGSGNKRYEEVSVEQDIVFRLVSV